MGLAGALAAAPSAWAIVGGVEGGPLESAAVMVLNDRGGVCTGVVLSPTTVLTAAHCLPKGGQARVHYRQPGAPVLLAPRAVAIHPGYRAEAISARVRSIDLALIRLGAPLPERFATATLAARPARGVGAGRNAAGFGVAREGDPSTTGTWRSASLAITQPHGKSRLLIWAHGAGGACQGDSGGPLIGADGLVAGLVSWSEGQGRARCGALTQGVILASQRGWIDETLGRWGEAAAWR